MNMRMTRHLRVSLNLGAALIALSVTQPAMSQTAATPVVPISPVATNPQPEQVETSAATDGEIIVTAQRRSQNLRDVPVSVQAFGAEQLAVAGVGSTDSLVALTPSISVNKFLAPFQSSIRIRGVGSNVSSPIVEPSVSMVIDGVVISRQASFFTDLVDIEQIEVLRGPQSTLFGKNAVAGALNISTARPSLDKFDGLVEATYNSFDDVALRGTISAPLTSTLGFRLTGSYFDEGRGAIENVLSGGPSLSGDRSIGVRGKLLWEPTADTEFMLIGDYRHASGPNTVRTPVRFESLAVQNLYGVGPVDTNNRRVAINGGPFGGHDYSSDDWGVSLEGNTKLGEVTLTSITAYRRYNLDSVFDADGLPTTVTPSGYDDLVTIPGVGSVTTGRLPLTGVTQLSSELKSDQFSQEIRLTSPSSGSFRWLVGGYYWSTTLNFDNRQVQALCPFNTAAPGFRAPPPQPVLGDGDPQALTGACSFPAPNGVNNRFRTIYDVSTDYLAGFGQVDLDLGSRVTLTAGARYQHDVFNYKVSGGLGGTFTVPNTAVSLAPFTGASRQVNNVLTGKASATYKIDQSNNVYASYSRGYKGPGADAPANLAVAPASPLLPERVDAYELGYKGRLFDALNLNVALFWQDFSNLQQQAYNFQTTTFQAVNAGTSRQRGVEADATLRVSPRLQFTGSLTYLDAIYTSFPNADCFAPRVLDTACRYKLIPGAPAAGTKDVSGQRVVFSPKWSYNIAANYRIPIGPNSWLINANYRFVDSQISASSQDPLSVLPSYGILDLRVGVEFEDGRYSVTGFVNNVFDKSFSVFTQPYNYSGQVNPLSPSTVTWVIPKTAERSFGVTARAKF